MPRIQFVKNMPPLEVNKGANLMRSLLKAGLPVASSCGGFGICAKCQIRIVEGGERLSEESDLERGLKARDGIVRERRISCQTRVLGDVTVDATYW